MNYTSLKYFLIVAEELNITRAAQRLFISQQSLSEHIAKLESEYGVKLFERTPRLRLTYAGSCMRQAAEQAIDMENQLIAQMLDISQQERGHLSVGMPPAHGRAIAADLFSAYHEKYPKVDLHLVIDNSARLAKAILGGMLDLAICFDYNLVSPKLEKIPFIKNELCFVIPENILTKYFHVSREDVKAGWQFDPGPIQNTPMIVSTPESAVQTEFLHFLQHYNISCKETFGAIRDHQTRMLLCSRGLGATFAFQIVAQSFLREYRSPNRLYCFPVDTYNRDNTHSLSITYLHGRYLSNAANDFIRVAQESVSPPAWDYLCSD